MQTIHCTGGEFMPDSSIFRRLTMQPVPGNRRVSLREVSGLEALRWPLRGNTDRGWWFARIKEVSPVAIRLALCRPFPSGTVLLLDFPGLSVFRCCVRVIQANRDEHSWLLGCSFFEPLDEEQVRSLIGGA